MIESMVRRTRKHHVVVVVVVFFALDLLRHYRDLKVAETRKHGTCSV